MEIKKTKFTECNSEFWETVFKMVMAADDVNTIVAKEIIDNQNKLPDDIKDKLSNTNLTEDDINEIMMTLLIFSKECLIAGVAIGVRATQIAKGLPDLLYVE